MHAETASGGLRGGADWATARGPQSLSRKKG